MKELDKFVIKSFIGPLILTFFIVLIILLLQFLWMYIDELAGKGLGINILSELLFQFSLSFVPTALPLAILLAALMTFGNMGEFSELTALKSSGIPLKRIMKPLIVLISFLVIVSFFFSNYILPYSNRQARLLLYDIRRKRPDINLQAGTFNNDIDGFSIKVGSKDPVTNRLDKLLIYDHRNNKGNVSVTYADSGYMKITSDETGLIMTLYNGVSFSEIEENNVSHDKKRFPSRKDSFKEQTIVISLTGFDLERSGHEMFKSTSWMLNLEQLSHFADSLTKDYHEKNEIQYNEFRNTRLYIEPYPVSSNIKLADSTLSVKNSLKFNSSAIFDTLRMESKTMVLERAIETMRDANNFISSKTESMKVNIRYIKKYEIDWHKKFTLPFACLVFFFIGAPLGAIIRKGGLGTPSVISIFFFVVWYVISLSGEKLVEEDLVGSIPGMWASSYI
ncbi:MAG: LptF/LptG family permease, partial [Bacteroidales bacterium]|nr:LptF/LptG family permease [Bacteroidales bacterium]